MSETNEVDRVVRNQILYNAHIITHNNTYGIFGDVAMSELYDHKAPKKPTNLSINSDLLNKSKSLNINLSATLEQALNEILALEAAEEWKKQNAGAISAYNNFIEQNGCFGDEERSF